MGKFIDLTGQKFGRLTVIERAENKGGKVRWLCRCECGNKKIIQGASLKSGHTTSCGCLRGEKLKEQWKDEDFRKMQSEKVKQLNEEQWQDENFRQMQSKRMKEQWKDEDLKKMRSKRMKEQWQDEEFRKMKSEKSSERMKEQWHDEDFRKMKSEQMKEKWQNEEMKWKMGYKGGITPISNYLRTILTVKQWRKDTYVRENYTCQLTGKHVHGGNSDVHHLYGFNTIVKEAHDLHNIQIKEIVSDYTEQELKLLEDYVTSWHTDTTNAVLLSDEVHDLFHHEYGYGDNTPQQYEEFKQRYLAGEFNNLDSNNNKVA